MKMAWKHRYMPPSQKRFLLLLLFLFVLCLSVIVVAGVQMESILSRLATTKVSNTVNRIVSEAVNDAVERGDFAYEKLISFEKDKDGKVTAVKSNMPEFNRLQSVILDDVLERISEVSTREVSIPVGSLTGLNLLAGRGPMISVRMQTIGTSTSDLKNVFTSAGINQTRHQILLNIDVYVSILLPGFTTATVVSNSLVVAETIIVGSVPNSYMYFQSDTPLKDVTEAMS